MIEEVFKTVKKLNLEIYNYFEQYRLPFPLFELRTEGRLVQIGFMETYPIWDSKVEEREFYKETNKYESLESYLRREAQKIINANSIFENINILKGI